MNNLSFVIRQLRKTPGFTFLAIGVLALGLGMSTAIFGLIDEVFFHGLPFAEPERVVRIYGQTSDGKRTQAPFSIPRFWHYRDGQNAFSALAADRATNFTLSGMGDPIQLNGSSPWSSGCYLGSYLPLTLRIRLAKCSSECPRIICSWLLHLQSFSRRLRYSHI